MNPDRAYVTDSIETSGSQFRIKGNDVVVTKPDGKFVTILKDGVKNNGSVKSALKDN